MQIIIFLFILNLFKFRKSLEKTFLCKFMNLRGFGLFKEESLCIKMVFLGLKRFVISILGF